MSRKITISEMEQIGEIWYQRCHMLREYWQDESRPLDKRAKAYGLWTVMFRRTLFIAKVLNRAKTPKFTGKFEPGGITTNIP